MRTTFLILAGAILLASPAIAATRACDGQAKGTHNESVQATVEVSDDGSISEQTLSWMPPSSGSSPFPMLIIDYAVSDGRLGAVTGVAVGAYVDAHHPPKSPYAVILVKLDGDAVWSAEWGMYRQNIGGLQSNRGLPPGAQSEGFFGIVPLAFPAKPGNPGRNSDLLAALATAHAGTLLVGGHGEGPNAKIEEMIAGNKFNFDDKAGRDALVAKALAAALAAAKHPQTCKTAP